MSSLGPAGFGERHPEPTMSSARTLGTLRGVVSLSPGQPRKVGGEPPRSAWVERAEHCELFRLDRALSMDREDRLVPAICTRGEIRYEV